MNFENDYHYIYNSWQQYSFKFLLKTKNEDYGFRKPQIAALHSLISNLISDPDNTFNIVMPTGTGKTDTMLALIIAAKFKRTLVIVPSDSLRTQIYGKASLLQTLREIEVIDDTVLNPNVMLVKSKLYLEDIPSFNSANVVIATPQALTKMDREDLDLFSELFTHLVIDEAHHVAAPTWCLIRDAFRGKPRIQFTATPFREDKKSLEGKVIYNYPLKEAQQDGYFKPIQFHPVREYNLDNADYAIAEKAVCLLKNDIESGYDHILLVRTNSKAKADGLFGIYTKFKEFTSVVVHSGTKSRKKILKDVADKKYRIIICVDMLGEGFDLPELKIAAIHDQHKSPSVTLQFIGRLTRVSDKLGDAKFVANIANQKAEAQISKLYEESADWSYIISNLSQDKVSSVIEHENLIESFEISEKEPNLLGLNLRPKVSTVLYCLKPDRWRPKKAQIFDSADEKRYHSIISEDNSLVVMVTRLEDDIDWARTSEFYDIKWNLYLGYYNEEQETLFIYSTASRHNIEKFIALIAFGAEKIEGEAIFRALHNIEFIKLQNVGLTRARKDLRFTMHVGSDVNSVIDEMESGTAKKSNIFTTGYEYGMKTTLGCSYKGKVWEMDSTSISGWKRWCDRVAKKINNADITMGDILKNVMRAEKVASEWSRGLFFVDWPQEFLLENEVKISFLINEVSYDFLDFELGTPVVNNDEVMVPIIYSPKIGEYKEVFRITKRLLADGFMYTCTHEVKVILGRSSYNISDYLKSSPLIFLDVDGSMVEGNYRYYTPAALNVRLPDTKIDFWDWGATSINKESMRDVRDLDTVQGYTFKRIEDDYTIIFNDDGAREIADLIAIKDCGNKIVVDLYHCKYCKLENGEAKSGARVSDVYEVCGQATRSAKWVHASVKLFERILHRYQGSLVKGFDRLLKGSPVELEMLRNKCHDHEVVYGFYIVQPAVSCEKISDDQLMVLGSSYVYIKGVSGSELNLIGSP